MRNIYDNTFAQYCLQRGGEIYPLIIPAEITGGTGTMNPSVMVYRGSPVVVIRHVNYTFFHSELKTIQHQFGPLTYAHPENDMHLRTTNYLCMLDQKFNISKTYKIDTSRYDTYEPRWDFVGLEDARLVEWDERLFITGVRRDTTTNGQGRMELSELVIQNDTVMEVNRQRIPAPPPDQSYCEKNWMPVSDMPYHYVKWSNPTEVVCYDPHTNSTKSVITTGHSSMPRDIRGGSQVLSFNNEYIAITHEVDLYNSDVGRKDANYYHRFLVWDRNWNQKQCSPEFTFLGGHVEFSAGLCYYNGDFLITFGFQDNVAYLMRVSESAIVDYVNNHE
jgi:hypothetical protein